MIRLSDSSILVESEDGTRHSFDVDKLAEMLASSCKICGINDSWLPEDIAYSVEYTLRQYNREERIFKADEIKVFVSRLLQKSGLANLAEVFRRDNCVSDSVKSDRQALATLISGHFGLNGKFLEFVVEKTLEAVEKLGFTEVPSTLALELARCYRQSHDDSPYRATDEIPGKDFYSEETPWVPIKDPAKHNLSEKTRNYLESGLMQVMPVSRLFPSIKINLSLVGLAAFHGLQNPFTEMAFEPLLDDLSRAFSELYSAASSEYARVAKSGTPTELPAYVKIGDAEEFSGKCLCGDLKSSGRIIRNMMSEASEIAGLAIFFTGIPPTLEKTEKL